MSEAGLNCLQRTYFVPLHSNMQMQDGLLALFAKKVERKQEVEKAVLGERHWMEHKGLLCLRAEESKHWNCYGILGIIQNNRVASEKMKTDIFQLDSLYFLCYIHMQQSTGKNLKTLPSLTSHQSRGFTLLMK